MPSSSHPLRPSSSFQLANLRTLKRPSSQAPRFAGSQALRSPPTLNSPQARRHPRSQAREIASSKGLATLAVALRPQFHSPGYCPRGLPFCLTNFSEQMSYSLGQLWAGPLPPGWNKSIIGSNSQQITFCWERSCRVRAWRCSVGELTMSCTSCRWFILNQTGSLQGTLGVSRGFLAANVPGIGSGWQQSKQNWALPAAVGK